jgi:predicted nucleic acid-binding OB-fold protein
LELEEMRLFKNLKSKVKSAYKHILEKSFEDAEKILEEERKRQICLLKKLFAEIQEDTKNQTYNVFVYDTIFYPPDSTHPHLN